MPKKTTIDLSDELFARARRHAKQTGRPLRALVEEGLRRVLVVEVRPPYQMADCSVGRKGGGNALEAMSWQDVRDAIYGGR